MKTDKNDAPNCASCPFKVAERSCRKENGKHLVTCPTEYKQAISKRALKEYNKKEEIYEFARQASIQEGEAYGDKNLGYEKVKPVKPRIVEIIEFSKKMKFKKIGIAFCSGCRKEAAIVESLFLKNEFKVVSVICKTGRVPKEEIGVTDKEKITPGLFEPMCNPIMQALVLNDAKTEFNIIVGLCVGHDSLFLKYSEALCTVFAVKDRLLGHNPMAAVYNIDSYYRAIKT